MKTEIILNIITILIGLYLALFKSYFQEKGKNIATSEDIENLTTKVESVKEKFIEKNSNLKAKLDFLTNLQIGHKNEERLALISFHKSISKWINLISSSSLNIIDDYDDLEIINKVSFYNEFYEEVSTSESLLRIYIEDAELHKKIHELKLSALEILNPNPTNTLLQLRKSNLEFRQIQNIQNFDERSSASDIFFEKRNAIYKEYHEKTISGFKLIIGQLNEYQDYVREYLKSTTIEK